MTEQASTSTLAERFGYEPTAEDLADRLAMRADDLIMRGLAARGHFNMNVGEDGVGIRAFLTNDTGSSGKGGDILNAGVINGADSEPWTYIALRRERKQIPKEKEGSKPLSNAPYLEEKHGRLGPLTGVYEFVEVKHDPGISSDHVATHYNHIDVVGGKSVLRPAKDGSLETAVAETEAKLKKVQEIVEAAEARHAAAQQKRFLSKVSSWFRQRLPFGQ